jgi:hypothetical protein
MRFPFGVARRHPATDVGGSATRKEAESQLPERRIGGQVAD